MRLLTCLLGAVVGALAGVVAFFIVAGIESASGTYHGPIQARLARAGWLNWMGIVATLAGLPALVAAGVAVWFAAPPERRSLPSGMAILIGTLLGTAASVLCWTLAQGDFQGPHPVFFMGCGLAALIAALLAGWWHRMNERL